MLVSSVFQSVSQFRGWFASWLMYHGNKQRKESFAIYRSRFGGQLVCWKCSPINFTTCWVKIFKWNDLVTHISKTITIKSIIILIQQLYRWLYWCGHGSSTCGCFIISTLTLVSSAIQQDMSLNHLRLVYSSSLQLYLIRLLSWSATLPSVHEIIHVWPSFLDPQPARTKSAELHGSRNLHKFTGGWITIMVLISY